MTCLSSTETEQSYNAWHEEIPIRDVPSPLCRLREDPPATDKRIWEELMPVFYYCKNKFLLIYVWVTKHHRVDDSGTLSGPTRHMMTHTISWSMRWWMLNICCKTIQQTSFRFTILLGDVWTSGEVIRTTVPVPSALSVEVCWGWPGPRNHPALAPSPWKISGPLLQDQESQKKKKNRSSVIVFGHEVIPADPQAVVPCLSLARHPAQQPLP